MQQKYCPICSLPYSKRKNKTRIMICQNGHSCCVPCLEGLIKKNVERCPICDSPLNPSSHAENSITELTKKALVSLESMDEVTVVQEQPKCPILVKYYFVLVLLCGLAGVIVLSVQLLHVRTCQFYEEKECAYGQQSLCCVSDVQCPTTLTLKKGCVYIDQFNQQEVNRNITLLSIGLIACGSLVVGNMILIAHKVYQNYTKS